MPTLHDAAFAGWLSHTSDSRTETETTLLNALKEAFPDHHVTRTNASKCDVLGYAAAGFATATRCGDAGYDATRVYRAPQSRLDGVTGQLEDVCNFGKWQYKFGDSDLIIYEMTYQDQFLQVIKVQYILTPRAEDALDGLHHHITDEILLAAGVWTKDVHEQVWVYDDQEWSKSNALWQAVQGTTWDDVVLEPTMRANLHRDIHGFFDNRDLYQKVKIPWKRGIIFHGVPGNGKSMALAVTINELAKRSPPVPALYVRSLDACSGPKWSLQEIFKKARHQAPCLLILEDLDSLVTNNTRSYFLNQVDGLESNDGILIIGSTNHLDRLDTSVTKRPSRFDRKYHFQLPGEVERRAYCHYWRKKFAEDASDVAGLTEEMCDIIAKWTIGYSFAYLKELFVTSLLLHAHGEEMESERGGSGQGFDQAQTNGATHSTKDNKAQDLVSLNGNAAVDNDLTKARNSNLDGEMEPASPAEAPRTLPDIEIPPSLQDNTLLQIFRTQAQTLLEEMDTSGGKDEKTPASANGDNDPPIKFRLPSMLDQGDDS